MSESACAEGTPDQDLWTLLQELEDGTIEPGPCEELMVRLEQSPEARRIYFEFFQQSAVFKAEAAKMHEQGRLPVVDNPLASRRSLRRSVLAAAAVLLITALVATLIIVRNREPVGLTATVSADARWMIDGAVQDPDAAKLTPTTHR